MASDAPWGSIVSSSLLILKLGTLETGHRGRNADRDKTVKKGDIVAQLDADLQRNALKYPRQAENGSHTAEQTRLNSTSG